MKRRKSVIIAAILLMMVAVLPASAEEAADAAAAAQETAPAADALSVNLQHLIVMPAGSTAIMVQEFYEVANVGEALTGDSNFTITLPEGYQDLQFTRGIDQNSARVEDGRIIVSREIPAGETVIGIGYRLQADSPHLDIVKQIEYPTGQLQIIAPPQGVEVSSEQLHDGGLQTQGTSQYRFYFGEQIAAGETLEMNVTLTGSSGGGGTAGPVTQDSPEFHSAGHIRFWKQSPFAGMNAHLFLFLVIVIPLTALGFYLYQRKKFADANVQPADDEEEMFQKLLKKQQSLLARIKDLEKQHVNQEIDEETYQQLRETYKKKLVKVKAKLKELAG